MELLDRLLARFVVRPRGWTFVSYSYKDKAALDALEELVLREDGGKKRVRLRPFPPIATSPIDMVSSELLSAIHACKSFVFIDTPDFRASRWVIVETDYARRVRKPVFRFDPTCAALTRDKTKPLDLAVFPSFHREDRPDVMKLLSFMKKERFFDVFDDAEEIAGGNSFVEKIEQGMTDRLSRGGFTVLFWTENSADSQYVKQELQYTAARYPDQILVVVVRDLSLPSFLANCVAIKVRRISVSQFDLRDVDDVIVWLQWLIQRVQHGDAG